MKKTIASSVGVCMLALTAFVSVPANAADSHNFALACDLGGSSNARARIDFESIGTNGRQPYMYVTAHQLWYRSFRTSTNEPAPWIPDFVGVQVYHVPSGKWLLWTSQGDGVGDRKRVPPDFKWYGHPYDGTFSKVRIVAYTPGGLSCTSAEHKLYAYQTSGGFESSWKPRSGTVLSASIGRSVIRSPALPSADTSASSRTTTSSIGLVQPLLRGSGREVVTLNEQLAALGLAGARQGFEQAMSDLVLGCVSAYFGVEQAKRNVALARAAVDRTVEAREVNRALLAAGRIARTPPYE